MNGLQLDQLASAVYGTSHWAGPASMDFSESPSKIRRWVKTERNLSRQIETRVLRALTLAAERKIEKEPRQYKKRPDGKYDMVLRMDQ